MRNRILADPATERVSLDCVVEIHARRIRLIGSLERRAQFPSWLRPSSFASLPRRREGKEHRLARDAQQKRAIATKGAGRKARRVGAVVNNPS